ncbi:hypothetical protein [Selenomonas sp. AB3002]|uniref:hypothetical protein n=1 Tax=Selenomonas sp. AB3002 TaxID=1392502 RepID=UPI0004986A76
MLSRWERFLSNAILPRYMLVILCIIAVVLSFHATSYAKTWRRVPISNITDEDVSDYLKAFNENVEKKGNLKVKLVDLYKNDNEDGRYTYLAHFSDPYNSSLTITVEKGRVVAASVEEYLGINVDYNNDIMGYFGFLLRDMGGLTKEGWFNLWKKPLESALDGGKLKFLEETGDVRFATSAGIVEDGKVIFTSVYKYEYK